MLGRTYEDQVCSIARALEVVGERWSLLIVRDAMLGVRRFDDFRDSLGLARNVLADRLRRLVDAGVLERNRYHERPVRYEYQLTDMGRELSAALLALMHWGDRHLPYPAGPPRVSRHAGCGGHLRTQLICADCEGPVDDEAVELIDGPGVR